MQMNMKDNMQHKVIIIFKINNNSILNHPFLSFIICELVYTHSSGVLGNPSKLHIAFAFSSFEELSWEGFEPSIVA